MDVIIRLTDTYPVPGQPATKGYVLEINGFAIRREEDFTNYQNPTITTYSPTPLPGARFIDVDLDAAFGTGADDAVRDLIDGHESWHREYQRKLAEVVEQARRNALARTEPVRLRTA